MSQRVSASLTIAAGLTLWSVVAIPFLQIVGFFLYALVAMLVGRLGAEQKATGLGAVAAYLLEFGFWLIVIFVMTFALSYVCVGPRTGARAEPPV